MNTIEVLVSDFNGEKQKNTVLTTPFRVMIYFTDLNFLLFSGGKIINTVKNVYHLRCTIWKRKEEKVFLNHKFLSHSPLT